MEEYITSEQEDDVLVYKLIVNDEMVCGARTESYSLLLNINPTEGEEGKGYAKKLLTHIEKIAREHNAKSMKTSDIDPCNFRAVSLFKSMCYTFTPIAGDASGFIEATKELKLWEAKKEDIREPEFEESRRCLLNSYHSYVQNHAGYMIAIIISLFALIPSFHTFNRSGPVYSFSFLTLGSLVFTLGARAPPYRSVFQASSWFSSGQCACVTRGSMLIWV